jgi:hypothetical protein
MASRNAKPEGIFVPNKRAEGGVDEIVVVACVPSFGSIAVNFVCQKIRETAEKTIRHSIVPLHLEI